MKQMMSERRKIEHCVLALVQVILNAFQLENFKNIYGEKLRTWMLGFRLKANESKTTPDNHSNSFELYYLRCVD